MSVATKLGFVNRWLAYFDILGLRIKIKAAKTDLDLCMLEEHYTDALKLFNRCIHSRKSKHLLTCHFSDSFLIYTKDDSATAYSNLQSIAKQFITFCLYKRIPMRGSITFGQFLARKTEGIFIGKAMVEAVEQTEKQNWIGLLVTKTAIKRVRKYKLNPLRHSFDKSRIPLKKNRIQSGTSFNFSFGSLDKTPMLLLPILEEMKNGAPKKAKVKYRNTINRLKNIIARNNLNLNNLTKEKK